VRDGLGCVTQKNPVDVFLHLPLINLIQLVLGVDPDVPVIESQGERRLVPIRISFNTYSNIIQISLSEQ
jgi:hypothetical protein